MAWKISIHKNAQIALKKLDKTIRQRIEKFIDELIDMEDPRTRGKGLTANRKGQWRYRVGEYRVICSLHDDILVIEVIRIGHRKNIYKK